MAKAPQQRGTIHVKDAVAKVQIAQRLCELPLWDCKGGGWGALFVGVEALGVGAQALARVPFSQVTARAVPERRGLPSLRP